MHNLLLSEYCKLGNFRDSFVSQTPLKDLFAMLKIRDDLPVSVNDSVISPFFSRILFSRNFAYAKFREHKPSRKFPNLQ